MVEVADILAVAGVTKTDAIAFLAADGMTASVGAVNAWARGTYRPPADALAALTALARAVVGGDPAALPEGAPEAARRRCEAVGALR